MATQQQQQRFAGCSKRQQQLSLDHPSAAGELHAHKLQACSIHI